MNKVQSKASEICDFISRKFYLVSKPLGACCLRGDTVFLEIETSLSFDFFFGLIPLSIKSQLEFVRSLSYSNFGFCNSALFRVVL